MSAARSRLTIICAGMVAADVHHGGAVVVPVHVTNLSRVPLSRGPSPFALSYHLWSSPDRRLLRFDNPRTWFDEPLLPGAERTVDVPVAVPDLPGTYEVEFDVVWEGVLWMKDHGNPTARVQLSAIDPAADAAVAAVSGGAR